MTPRRISLAAATLPLLCALVIPNGPAGAAASPQDAGRPRAPVIIHGVPDTGQFLPDTTVILRVGDRITRVSDFVGAFFASSAEYRPAPDSLGRLEFLNSLINKEILALTALEANRPLGFEDRAVLRQHRERALANIAYQRLVLDSIRVSEEDIRGAYAHYGYQQRLRFIRFAELGTAERVRDSLASRRLTWERAVPRYHRALPDEPPDGELGWVPRPALDFGTALAVFELQPGQISPVIPAADGFGLYQALERRPVDPPAYSGLRRLLLINLRTHRAEARAGQVQREVARDLEIRHDVANIAWAAPQFSSKPLVEASDVGEVVLNLDREVPHFAPPDLKRILARHRDGEFTLGQFVDGYAAMAPALRPIVSDVASFREHLDIMILEPHLARLAEARGFDRDSLVLAQMARREEQIRVEHLYGDSVERQVWNDPQERRAFYQENLHLLVTYPTVRFAAIVRFSQEGADSLAARLRAGERARDILLADSLAGLRTGSIQERRQNEHGPHHTLLFEELRPGEARVIGPDRSGHWLVLQSLGFDPGRQLSYEEAEHLVDDSLRNQKSEAMLQALIARQRARHVVVAHPERLMRIRLLDPAVPE